MEPLITEEHRRLTKEEFLERLPELDGAVAARVASARSRRRAVWFLGNADLTVDEYNLGFTEIPAGDPMAQSRESDNVLRIQPRLWRRPVTLIGPGAGAAETVTGLIGGLTSAMGRR